MRYPGKINEVQFPGRIFMFCLLSIDMCTSNKVHSYAREQRQRVRPSVTVSPIKARLALAWVLSSILPLAWCRQRHGEEGICRTVQPFLRSRGIRALKSFQSEHFLRKAINFSPERVDIASFNRGPVHKIKLFFVREKGISLFAIYDSFWGALYVRVNSPARPDIRRGGHARGIIHREGK